MNCPNCATPDVARSCVIYAGGTFSGSSSSVGTSSYIPGYGTVLASAASNSSAQTALAKLVEPPERLKAKSVGCTTLFGGVVLGFPLYWAAKWILGLFGASAFTQQNIGSAIGFIPFVLLVPFGVIVWIYNLFAHRTAMQEWTSEWICLRCGRRWIP